MHGKKLSRTPVKQPIRDMPRLYQIVPLFVQFKQPTTTLPCSAPRYGIFRNFRSPHEAASMVINPVTAGHSRQSV